MMTIFSPGCINSFCFMPGLLPEGSSAGSAFYKCTPTGRNGLGHIEAADELERTVEKAP